jgi:hypothetical protein
MDSVRVEKMIAIFKAQGVDISIEQAILILEFLSKLAKIAVDQCLSE